MPNTNDFRVEITNQIENARKRGLPYIDISSKDIHTLLGGYPGRNHAMKSCCQVMYSLMSENDKIISAPTSGFGASVIVRYYLKK